MKIIAKLIGIFALLSLLSACGGGSNGASFTNPGTGGGGSGGGTTGGTTGTVAAGSLALISTSSSLPANGTSFTNIRATLLDIKQAPVVGATVNFTTNAGTLSATSATTDVNGIAQVQLTSTTAATTANVTASSDGFNQFVSVPFTAGAAVAANSSITGSPSSLAADGVSVSTITVLLVDANNNLVADGTPVNLGASAGTITSTNPTTTTQGRATFSLKAPSITATATLTVASVSGLSGTVVFGAAASGDPANVLLTVAKSQVSVAGVGQAESTTITITVKDGAGNPISESGYGSATADNLRVSILSQPNGGEFISGTNGAGSVVNTQSGPMLVRTLNGSITLNFQSGTLPGIVEVKVEALLDHNGTALATPVSAIAQQISVASGPPSSIVLTYPITKSIENLTGGVYQRVGTALVTDKYGNAVADGTVINFGVLDSVIAMGTDGATTAASPTLSSASASFTTAAITRNGTTRFIQANDRILLDNASVTDKSRFVMAAPSGANTLTAQSNFLSTSSARNYVVGAATIGTQIYGVDANNNLVIGTGVVKNGSATFKVKYPANQNTILTGCYGYSGVGPETYSTVDTRYGLNTSDKLSAQVYVVASTNNNTASTVERGTFCLASIAGWTLTPSPATISSTTPVGIELRDGGDTIPLPFVPVSVSVAITTNTGGLSVTVSPSPTGRTDVNGVLSSTITVTGGASGDAATVSYFTGDATTTVAVKIP